MGEKFQKGKMGGKYARRTPDMLKRAFNALKRMFIHVCQVFPRPFLMEKN